MTAANTYDNYGYQHSRTR